MKVPIIVLVVSADGSWNFDAHTRDEIVSDRRHHLFLAVPVRCKSVWKLDIGSRSDRLHSLTDGGHLFFNERWSWRKRYVGSRCNWLLRFIFIERIFGNHGNQLAFDREGFGVDCGPSVRIWEKGERLRFGSGHWLIERLGKHVVVARYREGA